MTTVTVSERGVYARDHAGKTGVCIAVSAVVQTVARQLDAADLVESCYKDDEPPRYAVEVRDDQTSNPIVRAVFAGALATLLEIERMNPRAVDVYDKRPIGSLDDARAAFDLARTRLVAGDGLDPSVLREQRAVDAGRRSLLGSVHQLHRQ